jgi:hypothetical protein
LTVSARKFIPDLPTYQTTGNQLNTYVHGGRYNVKLTVRVTLGDHPNRGEHELNVYLLDVKDGIASAFTGDRDWIDKLRTDYTPDKVARLRVLCTDAQNAARQAESACFPFGQYDQ